MHCLLQLDQLLEDGCDGVRTLCTLVCRHFRVLHHLVLQLQGGLVLEDELALEIHIPQVLRWKASVDVRAQFQQVLDGEVVDIDVDDVSLGS